MTFAALSDAHLRTLDQRDPDAHAELVRRGLAPCPVMQRLARSNRRRFKLHRDAWEYREKLRA